MTEMETAALEQHYQAAKLLYLKHTTDAELEQAAQEFASLGEYARAPWYLDRCRTLRQFTVGNTVSYGQWDGRPISWRVLEQRGKLRLLHAEELLTQRAYNEQRVLMSWKACSLRAWLNHDFPEAAFDRDERSQLVASAVHAAENPDYGTPGGQNSMDKVFLFGIDELKKYYPTDADRTMGDWWWTRTPGSNLVSAVAVYPDGSLYIPGININYTDGGVRPAMWILLKA